MRLRPVVGEPWPDELSVVPPPSPWRYWLIFLLLISAVVAIASIVDWAMANHDRDLIGRAYDLAENVILVVVAYLLGRNARAP